MKFYTQPIDCSSVSALIKDHITSLNLSKTSTGEVFAVRFEHHPVYLQNPAPIPLIGLISLTFENGQVLIQAGLLLVTPAHIAALGAAGGDLEWVQSYLEQHQSPLLNLSAPLLLEPVSIPKPWGREIWYTGIEARGQSKVSDGRFSVPLPWVLELFPQKEPLTLLKILDPLADPNLGNLYFELHEQKQEVYVVTHIDSQAWPDGVGQIQMGFCQQKRKEFGSDTEFKKAYLESVKNYRHIREIIDASLDQLPPKPDQDSVSRYVEFYSSDHNQQLVDTEKKLRQAMNSFIYHHPLAVGDVIKVPSNTPHSLQHGVEVIEFQTPVYERKILSFGQKVLTQRDWDTQEAMELAQLDAVHLHAPEVIFSSADYQLEQIVSFDDFQVQRLMARKTFETELSVGSNTLIMLIRGNARLVSTAVENNHNHGADAAGIKTMVAGQAWFVPTEISRQRLMLDDGAILSLAMPNTTPGPVLG